jgi:O-antigen/teichoic acid export membrane protein
LIKIIKLNFGHVEIISKGLNWLYFPILALILKPEILGEIVLIQSMVAILSSVLIFGQNRVVLKYTIPKSRFVLFVSTFIVTCLASILLLFNTFLEYQYAQYVLFVTYFLTIHTLLSLTIRANENLYLFKVVRLTHVFIRLLVGCVFVYVTGNALYYLAGDFIGVIITFIIYRLIPSNNTCSYKEIKENIRSDTTKYVKFGIPLFFQGVVASLSTNLDRFILNENGYSDHLGSYGIIVAVSSSIVFILAYYAVIYEVEIYRGAHNVDANRISNDFLRKSIISSLLVTPFLLLAYYCIYRINPALDFHPIPFVIFSVCNILMAYYFKYSYLCTYSEQTGLILKVSLVLAILIITLNYLLIPLFGMQGAAWAKLLAILITFLTMTHSSFNPFLIKDKQ